MKLLWIGVPMAFLLVGSVAFSDDIPATVPLLDNGGFEELVPAPNVPKEGGVYRDWTLIGENRVPAKWQLNAWFKGTLEIVTDPDPIIGHVLRITAPESRGSHIELPPIALDQIRKLDVLEFRVTYCGGPVTLNSYEYRIPNVAPKVISVGSSGESLLPGAEPGKMWKTFVCRYLLPDVRFRLAMGVAPGATAEIASAMLRPCEMEIAGGDQWLNVREFGATGSAFETTAVTTAGSRTVVVEGAGDFEVGQAVSVSGCYPQYTGRSVRGPTRMYGRCDVAFDDVLEVRGFDGSSGDWLVYLIELTSDEPRLFRWSDDLARTWTGQNVPVTGDWQSLSGGMEVRFRETDKLVPGHVLSFSARTQLVTVISGVEGNEITLRDTPTRSTDRAVMRHTDRDALQEAIDVAIKLKRNLFMPDGYYRLDRGLLVQNADITIVGRSGEKTVMDISDGIGAVFRIQGGKNVTVRNFKMIGHTSLAQKPGTMRNVNKVPFWCCALKPCQAMTFHNVENMLVENVHAFRMASEAFYCQGSSRVAGKPEPNVFTRALTFRRCSAIDCAANAFNNNDTSENTTVEYCRIDGAGWHAYEGPARFIRLIGNYVRNAGPFTIGDMSHRREDLNELGCGQAMIRDNVFESGGRCAGIVVNHGARQVTIANNIFVNYNGDAITVSGNTTRNSFPSKNMTVTGNIIDLTYPDEGARPRTGIKIDASHVIVADNQIYARGDQEMGTTGISITEGIQNVIVHDNLIRNCTYGMKAGRRASTVSDVIDACTFRETRLPLEWHVSHRYRGWNLVWLTDNSRTTITDFDPDTLQFTVADARSGMTPGNGFEVFPPEAYWTIHDNIITDCRSPVVWDVYGSSTSVLRANQIVRGSAGSVASAMKVVGRVNLLGNLFQGFDRETETSLELAPDKLGRLLPNLVRDNVFQQCAVPVTERGEGLWKGCVRDGNLHCPDDSTPLVPLGDNAAVTRIHEASRPRRIHALSLPHNAKLDGEISEWPWDVAEGIRRMALTPGGDEFDLVDRFCVAADGEVWWLAFRIDHGRKPTLVPSETPYKGDGLEISFRNTTAGKRTPIFMLWVGKDGNVVGTTHAGATPEQARVLGEQTQAAARQTATGWTCELRIPFAAMGLTRNDVETMKFNAASYHKQASLWLVWTLTGGKVFEVDGAGEILFK